MKRKINKVDKKFGHIVNHSIHDNTQFCCTICQGPEDTYAPLRWVKTTADANKSLGCLPSSHQSGKIKIVNMYFVQTSWRTLYIEYICQRKGFFKRMSAASLDVCTRVVIPWSVSKFD